MVGYPNQDPRLVIVFDVADLQKPNHLEDQNPTISRMVHVSHHPDHRGEGKDLNDLAGVVTSIEGRQPPTLPGEGGALNVFS